MNKVEVKLIITRDEDCNVSENQTSSSVKYYNSKSTLCDGGPRYYKLEPNDQYFMYENLVFDLDNNKYTKDEIKGYVKVVAMSYVDLFTSSIINDVLEDINKKIDELDI